MTTDITPAADGDCIVLDWGTTNLRAYRVTADGAVRSTRHSDAGVRGLTTGQFEAVFRRACGDWIEERPHLPVLATGMIGSRNGWLEAPYVACPARLLDVTRGLVPLRLDDGHRLWFVPGLIDNQARPFPEVMRGEESLLFGFGCERTMCVVLPGTHSKWARVGDGAVHRFATYLTGELYDLLIRHSFVTGMLNSADERAARSADGPDWAAFDLGLSAATGPGNEARSGAALLGRLFSVRSGFLAGHIEAGAADDYLSALLIGTELAEARGSWFQ
ncbi:MAG: 2-dehydro-3-deoxygalactonokinase, partial [Gammaproteobacteria bacterium]|nr:2-dehydro-3-deoxygalactonokinase [Gammaproteobacteria bacterium]